MFGDLLKSVLDKVGVSEGEIGSKIKEVERGIGKMTDNLTREASNKMEEAKNELINRAFQSAEDKMTDGKGIKGVALEKFLMVEEAKEAKMDYAEYIKLSEEEKAEKLGMTLENLKKRREVSKESIRDINKMTNIGGNDHD